MLEMDAFYLRSTYILSMARDKTKECLNLNRALQDRILQAQINSTIGIIELERGSFQIAHQIFLKSEAIAKEIKAQADLGLSMLKLKRMHFGFQSAKGRKEIKRLYKKAKKARGT